MQSDALSGMKAINISTDISTVNDILIQGNSIKGHRKDNQITFMELS